MEPHDWLRRLPSYATPAYSGAGDAWFFNYHTSQLSDAEWRFLSENRQLFPLYYFILTHSPLFAGQAASLAPGWNEVHGDAFDAMLLAWASGLDLRAIAARGAIDSEYVFDEHAYPLSEQIFMSVMTDALQRYADGFRRTPSRVLVDFLSSLSVALPDYPPRPPFLRRRDPDDDNGGPFSQASVSCQLAMELDPFHFFF